MRLVPLAPELVPAVLALARAAAPDRWSEDDLRAELLDRSRAGGTHVAVAIDGDGAVAGVAGWVAVGVARGDFYGAPVVAPGPEAAALLIARVLEEAVKAGAAWIRIAARDDEAAKRSALAGAGFRPAFDFVELARPLEPAGPPGPIPSGLRPVAPAEVDLAAHAALYNACFADLPNAPPIDVALAAEQWSRPEVDRAASLALVDDDGRERAFVLATAAGYVEAIAVDAALRGRAIGRWLLERALGALAASVDRATALIASSNAASLALFAAAGFREASRLPIYQRDLVRTDPA